MVLKEGTSPCSALAVMCILCVLQTVHGGRIVELRTEGDVKLKVLNDFGIPITGFEHILFEIEACHDAYFILSETSTFSNDKGKYFMVMLGTSKKKRLNGIKDSCFKCSTFHAHALKTTVQCDKFNSFYSTWDNQGVVRVGAGSDKTKDSFLEYNSTSKFRINYMHIMSMKVNATWRFRVDFPPRFKAPAGHGATVIQIPEDTQTGKEIFHLEADDSEGDNVTFTLTDQKNDVFKIEGQSLMLNKSVDFESQSFYSTEVTVSDGFHSVPASMAIRITDVNDEPPSLHYNDEVKVPEEMPVGFVISGLFSAVDKDSNDSMTFMLEGPESEYLNLTDNVLRIQRRIDHDGDNGHFSLNGLTFRVFDSLHHESNITKNITIMDMNDNAPKFPQNIYNLNISENSTANQHLLQLSAVDDDYGGNGHVVYSLAGDNDTIRLFRLNGSDLYVNGEALDLETMQGAATDELILTVVAVDSPEFEQPQTGSAMLRVKINSKNEFDPEWASPKPDENGTLPEVSVSEDAAPFTTVVTLNATDEDKRNDGVVKYSILSIIGASGAEYNKTFWIDSITGELKTSVNLDRDVDTGGEEYYSLSLMASDGGSPSKNTTATMRVRITNVNDNPPSFNNTVMQIPLSKSLGRGDVVTSLVVRDPDGDNVTYSLDGQFKDKFEYDGTSLKAAKKINHRTTYVVILRASDGTHDISATAIIGGDQGQNASSNSSEGPGGPLVVKPRQGLEIPEEYPIGTPLPSPFFVLGGDKDNPLAFELAGSDSTVFAIEPQTGVMKLKQRVDSENKANKTYFDELTLSVTDADANKLEINLTVKFVDINDHAPAFVQKYIVGNATENSTDGSFITELSYSDKDEDGNGNVTLLLAETSNIFYLDGDKLYVNASSLDYEDGNLTDHQHMLIVHAVDKPQSGQARTGETVVVIKVLPSNEYTPVWLHPDIDENGTFPNKTLIGISTPLAQVGNYTATDSDEGLDGRITYKVMSAVTETGEDVSKSFIMNPETGILHTTCHADSGATKPSPYFDVTLAAEDGGTPPKKIQGSLRVYVDVTQAVTPLMKTTRYVAQLVTEVSEDVPVGGMVKNFSSQVPTTNTTFEVTGKWNQTFQFQDNILKLLKRLDYEDTRMHFVNIRISDGSREETTVMSISVKDVLDETPQIEVMTSSIPEELPPLSVVGQLFKVTDADANDSLTYSLTGDDAKYFNIDSTSGQVTMRLKIDRDGDNGTLLLDQLVLNVTDKAGHTTNSSLNLTVLDMNDNTPTLLNSIINLNITENSTSDTILTTLKCDDQDDGPNGNCSIELKPDGASIFSINGSDLIADGSKVDFEAMPDKTYTYKVTIVTHDNPEGSKHRSASITIPIQVR